MPKQQVKAKSAARKEAAAGNGGPRSKRQILAALQALAKGGSWSDGKGGQFLWDLVSALRGPDSGCNWVKLRTTLPLRKLIIGGEFFIDRFELDSAPLLPGPREDLWEFRIRVRAAYCAENGITPEQAERDISNHFLSHIWWAVKELREAGIKV